MGYVDSAHIPDKKYDRAPVTNSAIEDTSPLLYVRGSRIDHKVNLLATLNLIRQFEELGTIRNEDEFIETVCALGLEEYLEWGRELYNRTGCEAA